MIFGWKQKRIEGLLAQSLYEPLSESERAELEGALASDASLRAEHEALRLFVKSVPSGPLERTPDLLPLLRDRLDVPTRRAAGFRFAYAGLVAALIVTALLGAWRIFGQPNQTGPAVIAQNGATDTLVSQAVTEANGLLAKHDTAGAYEVLHMALSRQPGDAHAGEAQWMLTECAFDLNRYSEAYDACNTLFAQYYPSLERDGARRAKAIGLRDLLAEAKKVEFASLQAFDVAKRDRSNTFTALEQVAANYAKFQGTEQYALGDMVAQEMAASVAAEGGLDISTPKGTLAAYEGARARCTSPVAVALLDMKIGDAYAGALKDPASAKEHYQRAAENPVLASLAAKALQKLD